MDKNMSPPPPPNFFDYDSIPAGYYDEVFHKNQGVQSKWHHLKFLRFRQEMGTYHRHLDLGCGPGTFIGTLPAHQFSMGLDVSPAQIEYAQQTYGSTLHQFQCFSGERIPFEDNHFDRVTSIEVIEHCPEPINQKMFEEIYRVLKPGGVVLVSTPNYKSLWPLLEYVLNKVGEVAYEEQHITHFNAMRLNQLLHDAHFTRIKIESYQGIAPFLAGIHWTLSDKMLHWEPHFLIARLGFLLFGKGIK